MTIEVFSFDKGINRRKENLLALEDGEMYSCSGLELDAEGSLKCRAARNTVNTTQLGAIKNIHRYMNWLMVLEGSNIKYKWDLSGYCNRYTHGDDEFDTPTGFSGFGQPSLLGYLNSSRRLRMADYRKFIFFINDKEKKAFTKGYLYDWGVENPTRPPAVYDGGAGSIAAGTYNCYYTFYVKFPNGYVYETGPSPVNSPTIVASHQLAWTGIEACPYRGTNLTIWRKLYRTVSGTTYFVAAIKDNTTTTYADNNATITSNAVLGTTYYDVPPDQMADIQGGYLQRMWGIKNENLYWSQAYIPFGFLSTSSAAVSKKGDDLVAICKWGDQLYIASHQTWYRLRGNDPDTWEIKHTFADKGVINKHTVFPTIYGILGLWYDGIYVFDGSASRNLTEKKMGKSFFEDISDLEIGVMVNTSWAEWDGMKYYFYYAESGTTISKCLVLDFSNYPDVRMYHDDFIATAHEYHKPTGIRYLAYNGYQYSETGNETITTAMRTGERAFQNIFQRKSTLYAYYDLDSNGKDVTLTIYVDGTAAQTITLNESSRIRSRVKLAQKDGYRIGFALDCADSQNLKIYAPWGIDATPVGV